MYNLPSRNKTNKPFFVPIWIKKGSKEIRGFYLSGIYDSEGYIYSTRGKRLRWRIGIEFYKNKSLLASGLLFMEGLRELLSGFGIRSSPIRFKKGNIRKDGSESIVMLFDIERSSFRNFYKHVNFLDRVKRGKLVKALESYHCEGDVIS
jgi:intein/homing endonuclease